MKGLFYELPDHEDMKGTRTCHECGGTMNPSTVSHTIHSERAGITLTISGIKGYTCEECGEVIFTCPEAKMIEKAALPYLSQGEIPHEEG